MGTYDCKIINRKISRKRRISRGGNLSSGYNSVAFSDTTFSIYKPSGGDATPTLSTLSGAGGLAYKSLASCSIVIVSNDRASYLTHDFSVHLCASGSSWLVGTKFNCTVSGYVPGNGTLSFTVTPEVFGSNCFFQVLIRSAQGTGKTVSTLDSSTFTISGPSVQFVLPSLARQATKQGESITYGHATITGGTSGLFYPYRPAEEFTAIIPVHCYLGAIINSGQSALCPIQKASSSFLSTGLVPGIINISGWNYVNFPSKPALLISSGFAIDKVMNTDFTLVIKSDSSYPVCSMAYRSTYFNPTQACAVYNSTRFFWVVYGGPWGWDGTISGGSVSTMGAYNSGGKTDTTDVWYEYKRNGTGITIKYGPSVGNISSTFISGTCGASDYVGCFIGAAGGEGTCHEIVYFIGTPATPP